MEVRNSVFVVSTLTGLTTLSGHSAVTTCQPAKPLTVSKLQSALTLTGLSTLSGQEILINNRKQF